MTYSEKLKDPRWQKKRLEILERDGWACRRCGAKDQPLHVHHAFYSKGVDPWDYPPRSLFSFCEDCHRLVTHWTQDILTSWNSLFAAGYNCASVDSFLSNVANMGRPSGSVDFFYTLSALHCSLRLIHQDFGDMRNELQEEGGL